MIQRKQTIYLLLAFICNILLFFFPIFSLSAKSFGSEQVGFFGPYGIESADYSQSFPVFLVYIVMSILTALGIALYKNRRKQLVMCRLNLIFHGMIALGLITFYYVGKNIAIDRITEKGMSDAHVGVEAGFFLVIAAIPFILLAIRGIRADEELLRSIDRIR